MSGLMLIDGDNEANRSARAYGELLNAASDTSVSDAESEPDEGLALYLNTSSSSDDESPSASPRSEEAYRERSPLRSGTVEGSGRGRRRGPGRGRGRKNSGEDMPVNPPAIIPKYLDDHLSETTVSPAAMIPEYIDDHWSETSPLRPNESGSGSETAGGRESRGSRASPPAAEYSDEDWSPSASPRRRAVSEAILSPYSERSPLRPTAGGRGRRGEGAGRRPASASAGRGRRGGRSVPRVARSGRGCRAVNAIIGESEWQLGVEIKEVYVNDEDIPPGLKGLIDEMERKEAAWQATDDRRHGRRRNIMRGSDEYDEDDDIDEASVAHVLFGRDSGAMEFSWSPMATFSGRAEDFLPENAGPTRNITSAYEAFRQFWDDDILEHIVRETNRYAVHLTSLSERFASDWYETNVHEIFILFAFWMIIGVIRMPSIRSCFSTDPILKTNIFRTLITQNRYWVLNRALHFANNSERTSDSSKLFCLGPVFEHLNRKFKEAYTLGQNITIDESLTLWKSNLSFRQYIRTKAARYGIRTFELCESSTGYLWSFIIYTGKDTSSLSRLPKSTAIVVDLMRLLLNKGHRLFLDNWFNSPVLARYLKRNKTDCVGTLRKSRKQVPALIKLAKLKKGQCVARHSGDVAVAVYHDKRPVHTISTCHGTESVLFRAKPGKPAHRKLAVVAAYNASMGGVDRKDQMLGPYLNESNKHKKWYKNFFKRLLNVSINNSRILLDRSSCNATMSQAFRLKLAEEVIANHLALVPRSRQQVCTDTRLTPVRFSHHGHYIVRSEIPAGARTTGPKHASLNRKYCLWCTVRENRKKQSVYICKKCEVPLCLEGCFEKFHEVV